MAPATRQLAPAPGAVWACDNSAFSGFDEPAFYRMLDRLAGRTDCRWVAAPDVVGDHAATVTLWIQHAPAIAARGLRPAFVAQDGCRPDLLPWAELSAVFIGGTTRWKLGPEAAAIVRAARSRGVWVHMGRVNTARRLKYAHTLGVDSVDGTKFSRWSDAHLGAGLALLQQLDRQGVFRMTTEERSA